MIGRGRGFWATLVVIILVVAMILPLYNMVNIIGGQGAGNNHGQANSGSGDAVERSQEWIASLEKYLEENEPGAYLLRELASAYIAGSLYLDRVEERQKYLEKAASVLEQAVEMEPREPENYMQLYDVYSMMGLDEKAAEKAVQGEGLLRERLAGDPDNNLDRYYLSKLLDEYRRDPVAAREQLEVILASEPEGSDLYLHARQEIARYDGLDGTGNEGESEER